MEYYLLGESKVALRLDLQMIPGAADCCWVWQVSGEIYLSIGWRITPLDRVTLKVRALEEDLEDRQELLAMLTQRYIPVRDLDGLEASVEAQSEVSLPTLKANGLLEVKVIEAKNLVMPNDRLRSFYTMVGICAMFFFFTFLGVCAAERPECVCDLCLFL